MADFCNQCARHFGFKSGDMKNMSTEIDTARERYATALCEECGIIQIDHKGNCVTHKRHDYLEFD
jgi:hypothetical protein